MTRKMYDSVTWSAIPTNAEMVAGYINGTYEWPQAAWARFPHSVHVRIATRARINDGHVLDVEPGDATPAQAPGWVVMRRKAGVDPTVYCGFAAWETVIRVFHSAGVAQPHYWVARYDRVPELPSIVVPGIGTSTAVAKQYADPIRESGGDWDISEVNDHWPGVDPAAQPKVEDVALTDTEIRKIALAVWGYQNETAGDITDMHQQLVDARVAAQAAAKQQAVAGTFTITGSGKVG